MLGCVLISGALAFVFAFFAVLFTIEDHKYGRVNSTHAYLICIPGLYSFLVALWVAIATLTATPIVTEHNVEEIGGMDVIVVGKDIYNLNEICHRKFKTGDKVYRTTYKRSLGLTFIGHKISESIEQ